MATETQVKQYLAYWFQLGKKVVLGNTGASELPQPIFYGDRYSHAFENCWATVSAPESGACYLEGTEVTLAELLDDCWEIVPCARCEMPIPLRSRGWSGANCPCADLPSWPNSELPQPRLPSNTQVSLRAICRRLVDERDR